MSGSLHYARTQKQETPGVVKTFPHFLGGPPPTWDAILVQSFGKPSPGSSAITLVPSWPSLPCHPWAAAIYGVLMAKARVIKPGNVGTTRCCSEGRSWNWAKDHAKSLAMLLGVNRRKYVETCRNQIYPNLTTSPSTHIYIQFLEYCLAGPWILTPS